MYVSVTGTATEINSDIEKMSTKPEVIENGLRDTIINNSYFESHLVEQNVLISDLIEKLENSKNGKKLVAEIIISRANKVKESNERFKYLQSILNVILDENEKNDFAIVNNFRLV